MKNVRRSSRAHAAVNPIEKLYYEAKPLILMLFAFYGLNSSKANTFFVKLNILVLFVLAAYLSYSRLVHRGYINQK